MYPDAAHERPTPGPRPSPPPGGGPTSAETGSETSETSETVVAQLEHAVARLEGLAGLPVADQVARFEATHAALTEALSSIDKV